MKLQSYVAFGSIVLGSLLSTSCGEISVTFLDLTDGQVLRTTKTTQGIVIRASVSEPVDGISWMLDGNPFYLCGPFPSPPIASPDNDESTILLLCQPPSEGPHTFALNVFSASGRTYEQPKLVLFSGAVESACGFAQAAVGPFYCPGDRKVYIDLSFYQELQNRFGAPGDFAQAYVVAHEVGHHVQTLLGISDRNMAARQRASEAQANALSVRQELQADCFAGIWAHNADRSRQLLEQGDIEEGLNAASAIGDDRLQKQSRGYVAPESFTHGSSEQRVRWFKRGFESGDVNSCDTFAAKSL